MKRTVYRHYKGTLAYVLGTAKHTETQEEFIIYEHIGGDGVKTLWARPKVMFLETVTVNGHKVPRFECLEKKPVRKNM